MSENSYQIKLLLDNSQAPIDLLLMADPSRNKIKNYLKDGVCFVGKLFNEAIAVLVLKTIDQHSIEIKNVAVKEEFSEKGYGKTILHESIEYSKSKGFKEIFIATGNSSLRQLKIYQKAGFVIQSVEKDYFLKEYEDPIFENGIQCMDKIILSKKLI